MTMELVRNCSHGGEVATYRLVSPTGVDKFIKASVGLSGIPNLDNEFSGWAWYQARRYPNRADLICKMEVRHSQYRRVSIDFLSGAKPNVAVGVEENADALMKAVEHYCKVWPANLDLVPIHGDFSLDNVLIDDGEVHIIDWEHFNQAGGLWGFDALYIIFETLYFGMLDHRAVRNEEIRIVAGCLGRLHERRPLPAEILSGPLSFVRKFVLSHLHYWGAQLEKFSMKLPGISFTDAQIAEIDQRVTAVFGGRGGEARN